MKQNSTIVTRRAILTTITVLFICFIFYNSTCNADKSSGQSLFVLDMINNALQKFGIKITMSEHFVRKLAHFTEFFTLGALLFFTVKSYVLTLGKKLLTAPCIGLSVACIDETIQLFVPGRSCQITDVMLDFSGVCVAVLLFYIITKSIMLNKRK